MVDFIYNLFDTQSTILELSWLHVCLEDLLSFQCSGRQKKKKENTGLLFDRGGVSTQAVRCSGCLGDLYTSQGGQTLAPKKHFSGLFFFLLYFNTKYIEVAINDFKMHLIILKWLRRQQCRQKRKTITQKAVKAKEETVYQSVFIYLNM